MVLNSAERAPYLIHVELLEGDLDFDPTRRENRELLKKIVVQEDTKRRKGEGQNHLPSKPLEGFGSPMPDVVPESSAMGGSSSQPRTMSSGIAKDANRQVEPEEVEEMDLVEQLYGTRLSVKNVLPDLIETVPLPQGPKNKALDAAAWERRNMASAGVAGTPDAPPRRSHNPNMTLSSPFTPGNHDIASISTPNASSHTPNQSVPPSPGFVTPDSADPSGPSSGKRVITLEDYSERMRTAAVMLAQLNASVVPVAPEQPNGHAGGAGSRSWIPGTGWITGANSSSASGQQAESSSSALPGGGTGGKLRLAAAQAAAIRDRIMEEMMALEEERVERMTDRPMGVTVEVGDGGGGQTAEDEGIVRRELNKADPSGELGYFVIVASSADFAAAVFKESWSAKKSRIRASSPWGHLANWDVSVSSNVQAVKEGLEYILALSACCFQSLMYRSYLSLSRLVPT